MGDEYRRLGKGGAVGNDLVHQLGRAMPLGAIVPCGGEGEQLVQHHSASTTARVPPARKRYLGLARQSITRPTSGSGDQSLHLHRLDDRDRFARRDSSAGGDKKFPQAIRHWAFQTNAALRQIGCVHDLPVIGHKPVQTRARQRARSA